MTFGTLSAVGGTLTLFAADGSVARQEVSDGGAANFALSVKGGYSAVLDVDCGGYSVRRAFASVVSAGLDTVRVSQTSPHPAPPYDTWDNAAHTLQTARRRFAAACFSARQAARSSGAMLTEA